VTYKGHDCEHGYPSLEGLDAIYTRLVAALTAQPTQAMEAVLRDKERLTQRLRVAIEELYRLNDPDVKAITDRLVQIYREL
jgi:exonuclease VII large subunit